MATDTRPSPTTSEAPPTRPRHRSSERIAAALPAAILAVVSGFFLVTKTSEALTATRSLRALLVIAGIVVGWVVLGLLMRRFVRWVWLRCAVLSALALEIAVVLVRPYYLDAIDNTKVVKGPVQDASEAASTAGGSAPAQAAPVRVSTGQLRGIDHSARGEASLIRPDGTYIARFSNFDIEGAPDPIVYVVEGENHRSPDGADLGGLRGNVGTDSDYTVPGETEPGPGWTVLVWCRAFGVPIANATQSPV